MGDALETSPRLYVENKGVEQELPSPASSVLMHETPRRCGHRASPEICGSDAFGEAAFGAKSLLSRSIFLQDSVAHCPSIQSRHVLSGSKRNFARQIKARSALQEMFESQIWLRCFLAFLYLLNVLFLSPELGVRF